MRIKSKSIIVLTLVAVFMLGGFQVGFGEGEFPTFPESHKDLLGAASYMAYFGLNASSVPPGEAVAPGGTGMPPRVGPNTVVNDPQLPFPDGLLGRSETTIAADPSGRYLLSGWNDADGFCGPPFNVPCLPPAVPGLSGYAYSTDGGASWVDAGAPFVVSTPGGQKVTRGDPWMDTGGPGNSNFYYANLAVDTTTSDPGLGGMVVHTGAFDKKSFSFNNGVFLASPNAPNDFLDKEALCSGKSGVAEDNVAVSVTNFAEVGGIPFFGFGQIEVYASTDEANSFPIRTIVQPDETISVPLNEGIINQGSTCAFGPDGELYVVWERGFLYPFLGQGAAGAFPQIVFASSQDGGQTFGPRTLVSYISSGALFPPGGYNRTNHNDFPRIAVAHSGPYRGRVYVTYQSSEQANGGTQAVTGGLGHYDLDVYLSYSDDGGATWSAPILVAGGGDELIQFWPVVSVQPDGDVVISYNESSETEIPDFLDLNGTGTSLVDVYSALSSDGGASFGAPLKVTEVTTDWGATATNIVPNFGDYIFHVSTGNKDHVTWADGRNGVPDVFYATVKTK
jgi:hypothetical protein